MASGQRAEFRQVIGLLVAYGNQLADDEDRAALFDRLDANFSLDKREKNHLGTKEKKSATATTTEAVMVSVAKELPHPRSHEQKALLHRAARTLQLGVKEILSIEKKHPKLCLCHPAKQKSARPASKMHKKRPHSSAMASTTAGPTLLARVASSCLILGLCFLLLGLSLPVAEDEVHHSGGIVFCTGRRGSPHPASARAMNKVGPFDLVKQKRYILRVVCRPKTKEGQDTRLQSRVAIVRRGTKQTLSLSPMNETRQDGLFVNFDVAAFTVEKPGEFWCLVEAIAPDVSLRGNALIITKESSLIGPAIAVFGFVLLFVGLIVFGLGHLRAE